MLRNSIKKQNVFTDTFNRMKIKGLFTKPKYLIEEDIISCRFTHILSKNNHEATLELNKIKLGKDSK
ncbi:hypothetical protein HOG21_02680 [bacterium]|jgi:hypothetical protein|nr:hypothetical protein [bacterium]